MLAHVYFDWEGSQDELVEYAKKLESACKKTNKIHGGLVAPPGNLALRGYDRSKHYGRGTSKLQGGWWKD